MAIVAKTKNEYVRPTVDLLILGKNVMTADILSSSKEGAYESDKEWGIWEGLK